MKPLAISIEHFRQLVPIGRTKTYDLINQDVLRTVRVGRRTLLLFEDVERLVDACSLNETR